MLATTFLPEDVPVFLQDQGLVGVDLITNDTVEVRDHSGRNRVFKVVINGKDGFLLKQPGPTSGPIGLNNEATVLKVLHAHPRTSAWRECLPTQLLIDSEKSAFVTELMEPSTNLVKVCMNGGQLEFDSGLFEYLGRMQANFHIPRADLSDLEQPLAHVSGPIHTLLHRMHFGFGSRMENSPQSVQGFLRSALELEGFKKRADELVAAWPLTHLMHGDAKWENVLYGHDPHHSDGGRILLIDWEFARWGDPAWDMTTMLSDVIRFWLRTLQPTNDSSKTDQPVDGFRSTIKDGMYHEAVQAWLDGYIDESGISTQEMKQRVKRFYDYLPFSVLRICLESCSASDNPQPGHEATFELFQKSFHGDALDFFFKPMRSFL